MTAGLDAAMLADLERQRLDERYAKARELLKDVHFARASYCKRPRAF
jgi:hypothetical protein